MDGRKVKICCVVSSDITLRYMLFGQLKFLQSQGYDVHAVCSDGSRIKDIEEQGIKVKKVEFKRRIFTPISDMRAFLKIYLYFKEEKFDVVHVHTLKPEFYGQIAAKLTGVPIILNTLHGFDFGEDDSAIKKFLFLFLERISARCSTLIFSIGRHIIERAVEEKIASRDKFEYLGRDIDTQRFNPDNFSADSILENKKKIGISPDKKVIGIVARLVVEKGYLDLFDSLKRAVSKFPNVVLIVIGPEEREKKDGVKIDVVKRYGIEDNVIFLGERTDTEKFYSLMDIFVLPTHREGLGAAILEASSMGIPVIATDTGGCPEAVDDKKTGLLVPVGDIGKLTEAILFLLSNPDAAKQMGRRGREKIMKEFDREIIFGRLGQSYKRLIKKYVL